MVTKWEAIPDNQELGDTRLIRLAKALTQLQLSVTLLERQAVGAARVPAPTPEPRAELAALRQFDKAVRAYLRACGGEVWKVRFAVESTLAADGKGR